MTDLHKLSNEELIALVKEKDEDVENLVSFIKKTMEAFGAKDFGNLEDIGKKMLKGIPALMTDALFPNKIKRRFGFFMEPKTMAMFRKHSHYFTGAAPVQQLPPAPAPVIAPSEPKKLR